MITTLESFYYNEPRDLNQIIVSDLYKIKATQTDPTSGYLQDKIDNNTLIINSQYQLQVNVDAILHNITWDKLSISGDLDFYQANIKNVNLIECQSVSSNEIESGDVKTTNLTSTGLITANSINASKINVDSLIVGNGDFQSLSTPNANITTLQNDSIVSNKIQSDYAQITNVDILGTLNVKSVNAEVSIYATQAKLSTINSTTINASVGNFNTLYVNNLSVESFDVGSTVSKEIKAISGEFDNLSVTGDVNANNVYLVGELVVDTLQTKNVIGDKITYKPNNLSLSKITLDYTLAYLQFGTARIFGDSNDIVFVVNEDNSVKFMYEDVTGLHSILDINKNGALFTIDALQFESYENHTIYFTSNLGIQTLDSSGFSFKFNVDENNQYLNDGYANVVTVGSIDSPKFQIQLFENGLKGNTLSTPISVLNYDENEFSISYNGNEVISVKNDGMVVITGTLVESSDEKFKTNIESISDILEKVLQLNPVKYLKITNNQEEYGFIAQEIKNVFPEVVYEDEDGNLHVNYISLIAILTKAIQELAVQR